VLTQASEGAKLETAAELAGITLLTFRDRAFDEAWTRVLCALERSGA
jgi:hypothetical protein